MSIERNSSGIPEDATLNVVDILMPKILANYASKIEGLSFLPYDQVLQFCSNPEQTTEERIAGLVQKAGISAIRDEITHETNILRLMALGQESEVADQEKQVVYAKSDRRQTRDAQSRKNLDFYLDQGVEVTFDLEAREQAREYCALDERDVPMIEKLKAKRLLTINGFSDSRVMYAVHDMVDHAWLFREAREDGVLEKYEDFLTSIDMGPSAFLYSRQAELLASVGFGSRRWNVASHQNEELLLDERPIKRLLTASPDDRAQQAAITLEQMNPEERTQAIFMIENMAVQIADERRRWGSVKLKPAGDPEQARPMQLLEPLHVALMIDSLALLQRNRRFGAAQFASTLAVEQMLEVVLDDKNDESTITIPVPGQEARGTVLAGDKLEWLKRYPSVSTSYNQIG